MFAKIIIPGKFYYLCPCFVKYDVMNIGIRLCIILCLILIAPVIWGKRITVTLAEPGTLGIALQEESGITELIISGFMNETDFRVITDDENMLKHLELVDLGGAVLSELPERAFYGCEALSTVILPLTLAVVGDDAFLNCKRLNNIVLPSTVNRIGSYSFSGCTSLSSLVLPEGITEIPGRAFDGCIRLEQIQLPSTLVRIRTGAFYGCARLAAVCLPDQLQDIEQDAFYGCGLKEVVLPSSVRKVGMNAFVDCPELISVDVAIGNTSFASRDGVLFDVDFSTLLCYPAGRNDISYEVPSTVTFLGAMAFHAAFDDNGYPLHSSLEEVLLPNGLITIGKGTFSGCTSLKSIELPTSLREIGMNAFFHTGLTRITIPEGVTELEELLFYDCDSLKEVTFPQTLERIGAYAFWGCSSLVAAHVPDCVKTIEYGAFSDCSSLKDIVLPKELIIIEDALFADCISLTNIVLPDRVTYIGASAFSGCISLENVGFPSSLQSLADAFIDCTSLTCVTLPASLSDFSIWSFLGCDNLSNLYLYAPLPPETEGFDRIYLPEDVAIYVPEASVDLYKNAFDWGEFDIYPLPASSLNSMKNKDKEFQISVSSGGGDIQVNVPIEGFVEIYSLSGILLHKYSVEAGLNTIKEQNVNGMTLIVFTGAGKER